MVLWFPISILIGLVARTQLTDRGTALSVLIWLLMLVLVYLVTALNVAFARVTLYPDRIERTTWFGSKSMLRADVVKLERRGKFNLPILLSKRGTFDSIQLPAGVEEDAAWKAWMTVVQDVDTVRAGNKQWRAG